MKKMVVAILLSFVVAACGGKSKTSTTPANKGSTTDPAKAPAGGASYGGAAATPKPGADPCGGGW
jgi:hypothetical protein